MGDRRYVSNQGGFTERKQNKRPLISPLRVLSSQQRMSVVMAHGISGRLKLWFHRELGWRRWRETRTSFSGGCLVSACVRVFVRYSRLDSTRRAIQEFQRSLHDQGTTLLQYNCASCVRVRVVGSLQPQPFHLLSSSLPIVSTGYSSNYVLQMLLSVQLQLCCEFLSAIHNISYPLPCLCWLYLLYVFN